MADFVFLGFDLADKYRNPVMILSDGAIGQMMEKVTFGKFRPTRYEKPWATVGKPSNRERNYITSLYIQPERMEKHNLKLEAKFRVMREAEVRFEEIMTKDADYLFVAYGLSARICHKAVELSRARGISAGLLRPVTLWPFPAERLLQLSGNVSFMMSVELNAGQMVEDVKLSVNGKVPVYFYGRLGGMIPTPEEIVHQLETVIHEHHEN
jgi:2-oxoglutarate ferredoxin oxidoreductase subunit alpha